MGTVSSAIGLLLCSRRRWRLGYFKRETFLDCVRMMRPEDVVNALLGDRRRNERVEVGDLFSVKGVSCQVKEALKQFPCGSACLRFWRRRFTWRHGCHPVPQIHLGRLRHALRGDNGVFRSACWALRRSVCRRVCFSLVGFLFCWHGFWSCVFGANPPALSRAGRCSPFHGLIRYSWICSTMTQPIDCSVSPRTRMSSGRR